MASLADPRFSSVFFFLLFVQGGVLCDLFKVGDLDSWGLPPSDSPKIYDDWSTKNHLGVGDSLLFLYPPSEESLVQVTEDAYKMCNISNPIAYFDDGNTIFNITGPGTFYFTSGVGGHCLRSQKLAVSVPGSLSPHSQAPSGLPGSSSSYPNVFGPTGATPSSAPAVKIASAAATVASIIFFVHLLPM